MVKYKMIDNGTRILHWSDAGMRILQIETGAIYDDAADAVPSQYTYAETDIPVEPDDTDLSAEDALSIILGGEGV